MSRQLFLVFIPCNHIHLHSCSFLYSYLYYHCFICIDINLASVFTLLFKLAPCHHQHSLPLIIFTCIMFIILFIFVLLLLVFLRIVINFALVFTLLFALAPVTPPALITTIHIHLHQCSFWHSYYYHSFSSY